MRVGVRPLEQLDYFEGSFFQLGLGFSHRSKSTRPLPQAVLTITSCRAQSLTASGSARKRIIAITPHSGPGARIINA